VFGNQHRTHWPLHPLWEERETAVKRDRLNAYVSVVVTTYTINTPSEWDEGGKVHLESVNKKTTYPTLAKNIFIKRNITYLNSAASLGLTQAYASNPILRHQPNFERPVSAKVSWSSSNKEALFQARKCNRRLKTIKNKNNENYNNTVFINATWW